MYRPAARRRAVAVPTAFLVAASTLMVAVPASAQPESDQGSTAQTQAAQLFPLDQAIADESPVGQDEQGNLVTISYVDLADAWSGEFHSAPGLTYELEFPADSGITVYPLAGNNKLPIAARIGGSTVEVTMRAYLPNGRAVTSEETGLPVEGEVDQTLVDTVTFTVKPSASIISTPVITWNGSLDSVLLAKAAAPKRNQDGSYTALRTYSRTAFIDTNGNGRLDRGEITLSGVKLEVKDTNGVARPEFAVTTDDAGVYELRGVPMRVAEGELWAVEREALLNAGESTGTSGAAMPTNAGERGSTLQEVPDVEGLSSIFIGVDVAASADRLAELGIEDVEIKLDTITPSTPEQLGSTEGGQTTVTNPDGSTTTGPVGATGQREVIVGTGSGGAQLPDRFQSVPGSVSVREVFAADFDGDGVDNVAYRTGSNTFRVVGEDGTPEEFSFGRAGDQVHVGDFNGDGKSTIALRRGNRMYLRNDLAGGRAEVEFSYGRVGDQVLVGDWNNDGTDTIALRRGTRTFVRNDFKGGIAEFHFDYGREGDIAFVGDWDGDGVDTIAVRRGDTFYFANSLRGGNADVAERIGRASQPAIVTNLQKGGKDYIFVLDREVRAVPGQG